MSMPNLRVETFYVVDFDRTLADSDKLTEVFLEIADQYGAISKEQVKKADADMKQLGDSLDTAGYVRDHLIERGKSDDWELLEKQFIHESRSLNFLLPGAADLLMWLDQRGESYGILTYGNPLWQRMKLTAAGFNHVPRIIMDHKEKGRFISHWQQDDQTFIVPRELGGRVANSIVLIDDKADSFIEFPDASVKGYWILDSKHELPAQQGNVPSTVIRYQNLSELLEHI